MATAEQCRHHAAECLRLAQEAKTPEDRARLLQMAQAWRELADKLTDRPQK
jgi:hypothetical protein